MLMLRSGLLLLPLIIQFSLGQLDDGDILQGVFECDVGYRCTSPQRCLNDSETDYPELVLKIDDDVDEVVGLDSCSQGEKVCCPTDHVLSEEVTVQPEDMGKPCNEIELGAYECVPEHLCRDGHIVTDGEGVLKLRNADVDIFGDFGGVEIDPSKSKCRGVTEVCCLSQDVRRDPKKSDNIVDDRSIPKHEPRCGTHNINGLRIRVASTATTQFGEWPSMCLIFTKDVKEVNEPEAAAASEALGNSGNFFKCGASLLAPGVVLTAAHCINATATPSTYMVRCGDWDVKRLSEQLPHQDRMVEHIAIHPAFNIKNVHNDYAVLFTSEPFVLDPHIDTICLPDETLGRDGFLHQGCRATGWGKHDYNDLSQYQTLLQQVELPIVSHAACEDAFRTTRLGPKFILDENSFICAGGEKGEDTCKGDGGGPLMCPSAADPSQFVQVGITAWGIDCGTAGVPGAYANLAGGNGPDLRNGDILGDSIAEDAVISGVCYVRWVTHCLYGNAWDDFIPMGLCENFIEAEIQRLTNLRFSYRTQARLSGKVSSRLQRKLRYVQRSIRQAEALRQSCVPLESLPTSTEESERSGIPF